MYPLNPPLVGPGCSPEGGPVAVKTPASGMDLIWPMSKMDKGKVTNPVSMHVQLVNYDGFSESTITASHIQVEEGELKCDKSREDRIAFKRMKSSIKQVDDHFQLPLLWRNKDEELPNNFEMAKGRLASLKRKLKKDEDLLRRYSEVLVG